MHPLPRKLFFILSLLAGLALLAAACSHPSLSVTSAQTMAPFGSTQVFRVGQSVTFTDGLTIVLNRINDSRCPAGTQCIWAGELAPELTLHGGDLGPTGQALTLSTLRAKEHGVAGYHVALIDASQDSATLVVTKPGVTQPNVATSPNHVAIVVTTPQPDQSIHSPMTVSGRARGPWYFEASFPITLLDANGAVLVQTHAQGEWMTTKFVPFTATLVFNPPATATGELVLENDNPSGEAANAQMHRIPVRFAPATAAHRRSP